MDEILYALDTDSLVLCSTQRLARSLRLSRAELFFNNRSQGGSLDEVLTLSQWLDQLFQSALLLGDIDAAHAPKLVLTAFQEHILWERVIETSLSRDPLSALFDSSGLASEAMDAHRLLQVWGVNPLGNQTEETVQFLRWRAAYLKRCAQLGAVDSVGMMDMHIECVQQYSGVLPKRIYLAGFDRISPQQQRLFDELHQRGVAITSWSTGVYESVDAKQIVCDDVEAECRAVAAWAQDQLYADPHCRIAIVVPELAVLRSRLEAILDDTLHPQTLHPALAEQDRIYDFSLGVALGSCPMIATALALLRLANQQRKVTQNELSSLLRDVYWLAAQSEADSRTLLDAKLRRSLGNTVSLDQVLRVAMESQDQGLNLGVLTEHLHRLAKVAWTKKCVPSSWVVVFTELLTAVAWPGCRSLSSHEFQMQQAWQSVLEEFAQLDVLLGEISANSALSQLSRLCQDRIFQPEGQNNPRLQIMGLLETQATTLDAIWVMGMNDHVWPPPARPNPLLSAEAQRCVDAPNSHSRVQAQFAGVIHQRLLCAASQVFFSWSRQTGERSLRVSPLVASLPAYQEPLQLAATLSEQCIQQVHMQWLEDHVAPEVTENEAIRGGAGLLRAQAICPGWAFYQYRLGAKALELPVDGLDNRDRGSLVHFVLQYFWTGRSSETLHEMDDARLSAAIMTAIDQGVAAFSQAQEKLLPVGFLALEKQRLVFLLQTWLAYETQRSSFTVLECEHRVSLSLEGMTIHLLLDRIDRLDDGTLVVLDYKTGSSVSHKSWAEDRIIEPQLPLYASLALQGEPVAAVCFAQVTTTEQKFIGISQQPDCLPGVHELEKVRKLFPEEKFPSWASVIEHWKQRLQIIAREIMAGEAAVRFADENDLAYCDVKPLLRLPERHLQWERREIKNGVVE